VVNGSATVQIEPGFTRIVLTDAYHVFLTPEGDSNGLYVSQRSPTSFEVREQQGGKSTLSFSYRIVAKRADVVAPRLQRVQMKTPGAGGAPLLEFPRKELAAPVAPAQAPLVDKSVPATITPPKVKK
jgi:hypothetical protein